MAPDKSQDPWTASNIAIFDLADYMGGLQQGVKEADDFYQQERKVAEKRMKKEVETGMPLTGRLFSMVLKKVPFRVVDPVKFMELVPNKKIIRLCMKVVIKMVEKHVSEDLKSDLFKKKTPRLPRLYITQLGSKEAK
jgi:uncharacterized membrane protein YgcG